MVALSSFNTTTGGLEIGDPIYSLYKRNAPAYLPLNVWAKYPKATYPTLATLFGTTSANVAFASGAVTHGISTTWQTVAYGDGVWIIGGFNASTGARSVDNGATWTSLLINGGASGSGQIAYGNGIFISIYTASGNSSYATGTNNGLTWNAKYWTSIAGNTAWGQWQDVAFGNGTWIVCGIGSVSGTATPAHSIITSTNNGATWTVRVAPFYCASVAYGNGVWVVSSWNGGQYFSRSFDDGVTWTPQASFPTALNCINRGLAYGNGNFVHIGHNGAAQSAVNVSQDGGGTWVTYSMPSAQLWSGIAFGNGVFVAIAGLSNINGGTATTVMATSPDGITWTQRVLGNSQVSSGVGAGANGRFIAVAGHNSLSTTSLATIDFGIENANFLLPVVTAPTGYVPYMKAT